MGKFTVGDTVIVADASRILNTLLPVTFHGMRAHAMSAASEAGKTSKVLKVDKHYSTCYLLDFGGAAWFDEGWLLAPAQKSSTNVASALIAQRKLNQEQNIKIEYKCNCTFQDLMGWGHKCGRLAPIDKGYKK